MKMQLVAAYWLLVWLPLIKTAIVPANTTGNNWPYQTYKTVDFTPPVLEISNAHGPSEGYLFFAPDGTLKYQLAPLIMDMDGELVWNGPEEHAFGFGAQNYLGENVLVWWNGTVFREPVGRGNGVVYMYNNQYERIHETTLAGNFVEHVPNATFPSNIDLHEIDLTESGTMLVTGNNVTQADLSSVGGPPDGWVVEAQVYEIDVATNEVLFSWKSLDHLDQLPFNISLYPLGSEGYDSLNQSNAWGYFHINAVSRFDGGYILSSRYLCSAIAIGTDGRVKWRLEGRNGGDFTLGNGTNFCYQHDIRAFPQQPAENESVITLHMHDNANSPIDKNTIPTTGKSLRVDLENRHVTLNQQYLNASGPIFATAQGNYQALPNGNVFLGHGWIPVLEEFSSDGGILTTIQFGAADKRPGGGFLSASKPTLSYRAFKQPWIGCPTTAPDVVAGASANGTATVYVSWNGATEVEAWEIYGGSGPDAAGLQSLSTVPKSGFETATEIEAVDYVQVKPVMRKGCRCGDHGAPSQVVRVS